MLLISLRDNVSPLYINIQQELRALRSGNWVIPDGESNYKLTGKSVSLLQELEGMLKVNKKKVDIQVMGLEFAEKVIKYREIFPKIKLPSGKAARADLRSLEVNFKWFFENYKYSWETILKATENYVNEYERKIPQFLYMRTSKYFIVKLLDDKKTKESTLAEYCEMVDEGLEDNNSENNFSEKVV